VGIQMKEGPQIYLKEEEEDGGMGEGHYWGTALEKGQEKMQGRRSWDLQDSRQKELKQKESFEVAEEEKVREMTQVERERTNSSTRQCVG
jgi:hypothetical protein